jgi:hypothetical protein
VAARLAISSRLETLLADHGGTIPLGLLRTVVPAAPDAWVLALERYGTMSFGDVTAAAIRYARDGFTMHPVMAQLSGQLRAASISPGPSRRARPHGRVAAGSVDRDGGRVRDRRGPRGGHSLRRRRSSARSARDGVVS